jgi:predicted PurR-regulated permease PerM
MGIDLQSLSNVESIFAIVAASFALIGIASVVVAYFFVSRNSNIQERQAGWIKEMEARLDDVEPRLREALVENVTLRSLVNPVELMNSNTQKILDVLAKQDTALRETLARIERRVGDHG